MITIENEKLIATVNFKGAELSSLIKKETQKEYIWQADPHYWARHAPILFPIVGKLKNDEYEYDDRRYSLTQHGFARDMEFETIKSSSSECTLKLSSNRDTRLAYPFRFNLFLHYVLRKEFLEVHFEVENTGHEDMFFSLGGHPAFNCPLFEGDKRSDYLLKFEKAENADTQLLLDGLRTEEKELVLEDSSILAVTDELFDNDALIFENLNSNYVSIQKEEKPFITVHFENFPYLGIWTKNRQSPFICIEPWYGIADKSDHTSKINEKEGMLLLEKKAKFFCKYEIQIH